MPKRMRPVGLGIYNVIKKKKYGRTTETNRFN